MQIILGKYGIQIMGLKAVMLVVLGLQILAEFLAMDIERILVAAFNNGWVVL